MHHTFVRQLAEPQSDLSFVVTEQRCLPALTDTDLRETVSQRMLHSIASQPRSHWKVLEDIVKL